MRKELLKEILDPEEFVDLTELTTEQLIDCCWSVLPEEIKEKLLELTEEYFYED